jgi:hypothetical protein
MNNITDLILCISSAASLIGIIYLAGYWKGQVDAFMRQTKECNDKYPPAEMGLQVRTLWDIYGVEALRKRPDLAEHGSPWRLTPKAQGLIPERLKHSLENIPVNLPDHDGLASGWLVVKTLGLDKIGEFAAETGLTLSEAVGLLGIHLECRRTNCNLTGKEKEVNP